MRLLRRNALSLCPSTNLSQKFRSMFSVWYFQVCPKALLYRQQRSGGEPIAFNLARFSFNFFVDRLDFMVKAFFILLVLPSNLFLFKLFFHLLRRTWIESCSNQNRPWKSSIINLHWRNRNCKKGVYESTWFEKKGEWAPVKSLFQEILVRRSFNYTNILISMNVVSLMRDNYT